MPKAVANIIPVSPYHNHDVGDLADEIGKLCAEIADLEARRKNFREELIRRGVAEAEGVLFRATVSEAVRWTIDSAKVKAEMGAGWWMPAAVNRRDRRGQGSHRFHEARGLKAAAHSPSTDLVAPKARTAGLLASLHKEHRATTTPTTLKLSDLDEAGFDLENALTHIWGVAKVLEELGVHEDVPSRPRH